MNYILPFLEVSFFTESTFLEESFLVESTFTEAAAAVESTLAPLAAESVADEDLFALLQAAKEKDTARAKAAILNEFFMLYR